jgi:hypothetical protein
MLVERIRRGDYGHGPLPSTRKLGVELGVSKFTILQAFRQAEKEGLLLSVGGYRYAGGKTRGTKRHLRIACIVPAVGVASNFLWFLSIKNVASSRNGSARLVDYRSASDPSLTQALGGKFDIIFLARPHSPLTPLLKRLLLARKDRMVTLYEDMPELGLWGIDNMPVNAVDLLLFHLASLGHREIHLIGSQRPVGRQLQLIDRWAARKAGKPAAKVGKPAKKGFKLPKKA